MGGPLRHERTDAADVDLDTHGPPLFGRSGLAIALAIVVVAVLFLGGQIAGGIGVENRCNDSAGSARYQWHGLEWRWAAVQPGVWCTWTDTDTGEIVGAWAWGPLPDEHLGPRVSDEG